MDAVHSTVRGFAASFLRPGRGAKCNDILSGTAGEVDEHMAVPDRARHWLWWLLGRAAAAAFGPVVDGRVVTQFPKKSASSFKFIEQLDKTVTETRTNGRENYRKCEGNRQESCSSSGETSHWASLLTRGCRLFAPCALRSSGGCRWQAFIVKMA